jgi:hypothetical protein
VDQFGLDQTVVGGVWAAVSFDDNGGLRNNELCVGRNVLQLALGTTVFVLV